MDGRPNRKNNAEFSSFSGVMWTGPNSLEGTEDISSPGKQQLEIFVSHVISSCTLKLWQICEQAGVKQTISSLFFPFLSWEV